MQQLPGQIAARELSFVDMNVWQAAADLVRRSGAGALATVERVRGSTPVPAGTKMLVGAEGRLIGSVGGGCVEADVIGAALASQASQQPRYSLIISTPISRATSACRVGEPWMCLSSR